MVSGVNRSATEAIGKWLLLDSFCAHTPGFRLSGLGRPIPALRVKIMRGKAHFVRPTTDNNLDPVQLPDNWQKIGPRASDIASDDHEQEDPVIG
jgi:hypothetical protein